ncbi:MAG: diaminopimelate decarboxylase [Casimicrobiaceae bacterium]
MNPAFNLRDGVLHAEAVDLREVAAQFGTPAYVYSKRAIETNYRAYRDAFARIQPLVCYAVKANSNLSILALLAREGAGFDIVSGGELLRVLAAGGDPSRVIFSGVGKREDEIELALAHGIACFNVESEPELDRINTVALRRGQHAPISFRINPDVDPKTHPYISTGLKSNKFGVAWHDAERLYRRAAAMPGIRIRGIECHIGSQITELSPYVDAMERLLDLVDRLKAADIHLEHIDIGGGRGISYNGESLAPMSVFADALIGLLGARPHRLLLEPGRSIAGDAGLLLTRVEFIKRGETKNFAIVDAAMNDLIRPTLYGAHHRVLPVVPREGEAVVCDVVGPVCESGDWLARERSLVLAEGDLLAILDAGAYAMTMASNYNTRMRPAEVLVDGDCVHLIRERERFEDLIAHERIVG